MLFWAIVFIAAAVVLYAIIMFNSLVRTRQMANEAWSGIDVQLKRRSELVPNLVESVKGYATHERSVLEEVTRLRNAAREVPSDDVASRAQAAASLSRWPRIIPPSRPARIFWNCSASLATSKTSCRWRAATTTGRCEIRMFWCNRFPAT